MSEKKYTLDDVKAWALYEIGIEGEDFIYRKDDREVFPDGTLGTIDCWYYLNGTPSCIVGRMLHNQGIIDVNSIKGQEGASAGNIVRRLAPDRFTSEAQDFIVWLQLHQDDGKTWGESYRSALDRVNQ